MTMVIEHDETASLRRRGVLRRFWTGFVNIWKRPKTITWGEILTATLAAGLVVWLVVGQIQGLKNREVARVRETEISRGYESDLRAYDSAVTQYRLCVDSVDRGLNSRAGWEQLANMLEARGLEPEAEEIRAGPVLSEPPRTIADCGDVPVAPTVPAGES